jgi:tRNA-specific 2-thiouridylase
LSKECEIDEVNWIEGEPPTAPLRAMARHRYRARETPCTVTPSASGRLHVSFDEPQRALTPGQALVLYDGEYVRGGGTIAGYTAR